MGFLYLIVKISAQIVVFNNQVFPAFDVRRPEIKEGKRNDEEYEGSQR
jgi:hypothetical protein